MSNIIAIVCVPTGCLLDYNYCLHSKITQVGNYFKDNLSKLFMALTVFRNLMLFDNAAYLVL